MNSIKALALLLGCPMMNSLSVGLSVHLTSLVLSISSLPLTQSDSYTSPSESLLMKDVKWFWTMSLGQSWRSHQLFEKSLSIYSLPFTQFDSYCRVFVGKECFRSNISRSKQGKQISKNQIFGPNFVLHDSILLRLYHKTITVFR